MFAATTVTLDLVKVALVLAIVVLTFWLFGLFHRRKL